MFAHQGIWLPDGEKHFPEWMTKSGEVVDGRGTYQIKKWRACQQYIRGRRRAVDVGAHVGFWTIQMVKQFDFVYGFEPVEQFRECLFRNLEGSGNFCIHPIALGSIEAFAEMVYDPKDSGGTHIAPALFPSMAPQPNRTVEMKTLDSFEFQDVDFIKIDCEGYEHHVIEGARETLLRCKPCVIVEQKPHKLGPNFGIKGEPAVDLLRELGAHARTCISGDWICSWD